MMTNKKRLKQLKYCACCGKAVNGHDIIRVDHCKDYLKKQGYDITYTHFIWEKDLRHPALKLVLAVMFLFVMFFPVATAQTYVGGFTFDLTQDFNLYLLLASFIFAGFLFYFRFYSFTALILLADGFLMLMNGVNIWISLIPLVTSFMISGLIGGKQG